MKVIMSSTVDPAGRFLPLAGGDMSPAGEAGAADLAADLAAGLAGVFAGVYGIFRG